MIEAIAVYRWRPWWLRALRWALRLPPTATVLGERTYVAEDTLMYSLGECPIEYPGRTVVKIDNRTGHIWLSVRR